MRVIVLPPRKFLNLAEGIDIATFPILKTVDSILLIKCKNNLIINANDTGWDSSSDFLKGEVSRSRHSLLLKLAGYGDADMINVFKNNKFIEPIAATKPAPGSLLASSKETEVYSCHALVLFINMYAGFYLGK